MSICKIEDIRSELNKRATNSTKSSQHIIYLDARKNPRTRQTHELPVKTLTGETSRLFYNINTKTGFVFVYNLQGALFDPQGDMLAQHLTLGTTDPSTGTADVHLTGYAVKRDGKIGGQNLNHVYKAYPINQKTQKEFYDYLTKFVPGLVGTFGSFCRQYVGKILKGGSSSSKKRSQKGGMSGVKVASLQGLTETVTKSMNKIKDVPDEFILKNPVLGTDVVDAKSVKDAESLIKSMKGMDAGVFGIYDDKKKKMRIVVTKHDVPEFEKAL